MDCACVACTRGELICLTKFLGFMSWVRGESGKAGSEEGRWRLGDGRENFKGAGELQIGFSCRMSGMRGECMYGMGEVCGKEKVL